MVGPRVVVVANKWWEADPLCAVLIHDRARPRALSNFAYQRFPAARAVKPASDAMRPPDPAPVPRLMFDCLGARVEVWCLEELMNPAESPSSSAEKARVLPRVMSGTPPAVVIAFGTAAMRESVHANGSVVVGRRTFVHDPFAGADRQGKWTPPHPDRLVESAFPIAALQQLDEQARYAAEARFLRPPIAPADPPLALVGNGFASLGVVNVTNYDDYVWADASAARAFAASGAPAQVGSIETTHGIIRAASAAPFLFVSGITDTAGLFDVEVTPRVYAQNVVAAHNAGVTLAWLLPGIVATLEGARDAGDVQRVSAG
jgi:hypothetical protein